jgi:hypothetical protein
MANFYLLVFIGICTAILLWSINRVERIYQFPFFMVSVFLSFILPQAIADSLTKYSVFLQNIVTEWNSKLICS